MSTDAPAPKKSYWDEQHPWLARLALVLLAFLFLLQMWVTADRAARLAVSPILFSEFQPEQTVYRQGDFMRFRYVREVKIAGVPLLQLDSIENLGTGDVYPVLFAGRIYREVGREQAWAVRPVPRWARPGRYQLTGWMQAQGEREYQPVVYLSSPFEIKAAPTPKR